MKKMTKKLPALLWVLLLSFLATATANKNVKVQMMPSGKQNLTTMPAATWQGNPNLITNMHDTNTQPVAPAPVAKAGEPTIKVTFERDCDDNVYYASGMQYVLVDQFGNNLIFNTSIQLNLGKVTIPKHNGDLDIKTLNSILKQAGLK